jgi:predicted DsbA family dithiol-disulfide isomerase
MKVDIWSDIMCPFCYICKRKFEGALQQFSNKEDIEVVWHSFQLDPTIEKQSDKDLYDYLAEREGQTREWAKQVNQQVTQSAKQVGLTYNLDNAVVANSFDAHRLIQLAKQKGLGDAAEERLFKAYFTEGKI